LNPGIHYSDKKSIELDAGSARLQLPKVGWIRLRMSRPLKGEIRSASLSCEGSKWYVSIQTLDSDVIPAAGLAPSVGIDMGIKLFAALSNGQTIEPLNAYKLHQCRLRRYQRSVARKVKGSCNRKKALIKLKTLHKKIADKRSDWLHKITSAIVKEHPVIAIEDLNIKNMSKSCSGKGRQAKAGLNKGILDQAWGEFARQLDYKTQSVGGLLLKVPAAYTSQTCSKCGTVNKLNRQSQSQFLCVACGHTENADLNASSNILQRGELAWGELIQQKAAGHAASVHGEIVRPSKVAKLKKAVSKQWKPSEEVVP
jgi:putative transposase